MQKSSPFEQQMMSRPAPNRAMFAATLVCSLDEVPLEQRQAMFYAILAPFDPAGALKPEDVIAELCASGVLQQ